jgi:hypothetical protein
MYGRDAKQMIVCILPFAFLEMLDQLHLTGPIADTPYSRVSIITNALASSHRDCSMVHSCRSSSQG